MRQLFNVVHQAIQLPLRIETRQIDLVIEQMIQSVFNRAGRELSLQVNREKAWAGVDVLVTSHLNLKIIYSHFDLDI